MCARCEGRGSVTDLDLTQLYDETKSLARARFTVPGTAWTAVYGRIFLGCGYFDPDKPIKKFTSGSCTTSCTRSRRRSRWTGST